MKINEIASFEVNRHDDVRTFIGPVHAALVVTERSHGNSLFLQVDKDAGLAMKLVRATLDLAGNIIEHQLQLMDSEWDVSENDAAAMIELAQTAVMMSADQPVYVWSLANGSDEESMMARVRQVYLDYQKQLEH